MSHVFLSYVHEDDSQVRRLAFDLEKLGTRVWLDRQNLTPGEKWRDAIQNAIRSGELFVACFSRSFSRRERSHMHEELTLAIDELRLRPADRAWFIPVLLDDTEVPDRRISAGESLRDLQWLNLAEDWRGGIAKIAAAARRSTNETPATMATPSSPARPDVSPGYVTEANDVPLYAGRDAAVYLTDLLVLAVPFSVVIALIYKIRGSGILLAVTIYAIFVACYHAWVMYREYTVCADLHRLKSKPVDMLLLAGMFGSLYQLSLRAPDLWDCVLSLVLFLIFLIAWELYTKHKGRFEYFQQHDSIPHRSAHLAEYRYWLWSDSVFLAVFAAAWINRHYLEQWVDQDVLFVAGLSIGFAIGPFNVIRHEIIMARIRRLRAAPETA